MFDPNADPEAIAARAAELALEQLDRLRWHIKSKGQTKAHEFYTESFEIGTSNQIARLMSAYAVLKGYVTPERAHVS
jgi:hypothetical protein